MKGENMFRDKRIYRAIGYDFPQIKNVSEICKSFPKETLSDEETILKNDLIVIKHCYYFSEKIYSMSPLLEDNKIEKGGIRFFRYNIYFIHVLLRKIPLYIVATPFLQMLLDVDKVIRETIYDESENSYFKIDLEGFLKSIEENRHLGGKIKVKRFEFIVTGDPAVNKMSLSGSDAIHSRTYNKLIKELRGIGFIPRECSLSFNDYMGNKMIFSSDKYGNYAFRVQSKAKNLFSLYTILKYFQDENLLTNTNIPPAIRSDDFE